MLTHYNCAWVWILTEVTVPSLFTLLAVFYAHLTYLYLHKDYKCIWELHVSSTSVSSLRGTFNQNILIFFLKETQSQPSRTEKLIGFRFLLTHSCDPHTNSWQIGKEWGWACSLEWRDFTLKSWENKCQFPHSWTQTTNPKMNKQKKHSLDCFLIY